MYSNFNMLRDKIVFGTAAPEDKVKFENQKIEYISKKF